MANEYTISKIKLPNGDICNIKDLNDSATHTLNTTTKYYITGTTSVTSSTSGDTFDIGIYTTELPGELSAVRHTLNLSGTDKAYMVWNDTDQSIDFVFI